MAMGDSPNNRVLVGLPERLRKAKVAIRNYEVREQIISATIDALKAGALTEDEAFGMIEDVINRPVNFVDEEPEVGLIDNRPR